MMNTTQSTPSPQKRIPRALTIAIFVALLIAQLVVASGTASTAAGRLQEVGSGGVWIETEEGPQFYALEPDTTRPADLETGETVIVHHADGTALELLRVDATVEVEEEYLTEGRRAVLGEVTASSPEQVLVETAAGGQAFVVQSEKLFPPLPVKGDKVAVIYRVERTATSEEAKGEELVILPSDTVLSNGVVRVSFTEIEPETEEVAEADPQAEAALAETDPQPEEPAVPQPQTQIAETLPQTASPFTLIGLAGVALLGGGLALRRRRR